MISLSVSKVTLMNGHLVSEKRHLLECLVLYHSVWFQLQALS